ncbi:MULTISPECIES: sugar kinase [unclassified Nonlabens]|uniref:sugar kinase n=1 Tax=unclassified Nonlabens TaxID=2615035 RepID=UPI0038687DB1
MGYEYAIIVKSKTRLEDLVDRFNTKAQAKFYIERLGGDFNEYEVEDEIFKKSLNSLQTQLSKIIKNKTIDKQFVSSYIFSNKNIIVVIGQDGLVANTAKYSNNLPIIAVNPDPERYDGVLLPFTTNNFIEAVDNVMKQTHRYKVMSFAEVILNDGQRLLAFNDLFIGASSHVSARYKLTFKDKSEQHSSSGIIVSTQAGSTGWLSSVFNMAYGITNLFERNQPVKQPKLRENDLLFVVREPFKSIRTQTKITAGIIRKNTLTIESFMPNNGVIFSDGVEKDFLKFNSGSIATIGIAKETATIVQK